MELTDLSIEEASEQLSQRKISSVELTQAHLKRIEVIDPSLNSFITITSEAALQAARDAESALLRQEQHAALLGIPMALKDLFETEGIPTTAGSLFFENYIPESDCAVVRRLKDRGVVLLGKLNMHEIALGVTTENPHFGDCSNPWNTAHISGGSSGGSGAALAGGLCMGSLGTDTGGSIRIPASLCGIVGLKPTYGRVSLRGVIPLSWNLDHAGPMARRVYDVALLLQAIAGHDPEDPYSPNVPTVDYLSRLGDGVHKWRIALAEDEFFSDAQIVDAEVQEALNQAATVFEQLGAEVKRAAFPGAGEAAAANGLITPADAAAFHRERLQEHPEYFGKDVLTRLQMGAAYTSTEYILARRTQMALKRQFEAFFGDFDILITPATPITAPRRGSANAVERAKLLTRFTAPFNLTGLPAISLPCGFSADGLPIGMQIVARPWAEAQLLRAASAYERATEWHLRKPGLLPS
jgi:aspartyl-tRNA(Asn)/glutamyl-tRNA(Gln) amidotransferase subunit A